MFRNRSQTRLQTRDVGQYSSSVFKPIQIKFPSCNLNLGHICWCFIAYLYRQATSIRSIWPRWLSKQYPICNFYPLVARQNFWCRGRHGYPRVKHCLAELFYWKKLKQVRYELRPLCKVSVSLNTEKNLPGDIYWADLHYHTHWRKGLSAG